MIYTKNQTLLSVQNVSLVLGNTQILKDVNIEIKNIHREGLTQGQIVGLMAPSGVGKTKLFEIISGIIPVKEGTSEGFTGTVLVGDDQQPARIGRVGVVQQNYPLFNHRTILGNLLVAARQKFKNKKQALEECNKMLAYFDLSDKAKLYPIQLSGGQRQRVAIAQQLLCSNNFLLLDEPFSGLDINMIRQVSDIIVKVASMDELITIIIVSHDISATTAIADTLICLGRDRDAQNLIIPGAKVQKVYDLAEMGLAWKTDIHSDPQFQALVGEIKDKVFPTL